jgi:hypothetical protein
MLKYKISSSVGNSLRDNLYQVYSDLAYSDFVEDMTFKMACSFIDIPDGVFQRL